MFKACVESVNVRGRKIRLSHFKILCVKSLRKLAFAFGLCRLVNKCWAFIAEFQPSILPAPDLRTGRGFV
jgi:hypothetical protein